uniref:Transposase n=1 Tax=Parastrongyloides trichosuri TaxID=131310 RepID=A0A0N4Z1K4_PARTI
MKVSQSHFGTEKKKSARKLYKERNLYKREKDSLPVKINSLIYVRHHIRTKVSSQYEKRLTAVEYPNENMIEFRKKGKQKLVSMRETRKRPVETKK